MAWSRCWFWTVMANEEVQKCWRGWLPRGQRTASWQGLSPALAKTQTQACKLNRRRIATSQITNSARAHSDCRPVDCHPEFQATTNLNAYLVRNGGIQISPQHAIFGDWQAALCLWAMGWRALKQQWGQRNMEPAVKFFVFKFTQSMEDQERTLEAEHQESSIRTSGC